MTPRNPRLRIDIIPRKNIVTSLRTKKKELKDLRDAHEHNPKRAKKRSLKTQVATLVQQITTMQTSADGIKAGTTQVSSNSQDNHQEDTHTSQGTSNHNHPALTRQ